MILETDDPARCGAAPGPEISTSATVNSGEDNRSDSGTQAKNNLLAINRESIWHVGDNAAIHLDLALGCVGVADDVGLRHHTALAVNHMRAFAKLVNDLSADR